MKQTWILICAVCILLTILGEWLLFRSSRKWLAAHENDTVAAATPTIQRKILWMFLLPWGTVLVMFVCKCIFC